MVDYGVTKGAIIGFTKCLAFESIAWRRSFFQFIASFNLQVTDLFDAYSPGAIYTPFQADTRQAKQNWDGMGRQGLGDQVNPVKLRPLCISG
jgi:NAD(P)-dependent dehydrogenase (short-subunit alcohol dehydrogenase family)